MWMRRHGNHIGRKIDTVCTRIKRAVASYFKETGTVQACSRRLWRRTWSRYTPELGNFGCIVVIF